MATASDLTVGAELLHLREVANCRSWQLKVLDGTTFILELPARDRLQYRLHVDCKDYPVLPPAWHWSDPETGKLDQLAATPKGGGYFHSSGVICAPWNRLAYAPRGPHGDWNIGDWKNNAQTGGCTSLAAMALRIAVELQGKAYVGRRG